METLYECLSQEFQDYPFVSINIKPSHSIKQTKKSPENIITLTVIIYDKYHNVLTKQIDEFVNDQFKVSAKKTL